MSMPSTSSTSHISDFNNQVLKGLTAGALASSISKTTIAPIDRVKLILQLQNATTFTLTEQQQQYRGILDCFKRLYTEQGVCSLWRGNSATLIRVIPSNVLNLAFRDYFRTFFLQNVNRKQQRLRFAMGATAAGGAGGAVTLLFVYPLDFARTRLAVDANKDGSKCFRGMAHCFSSIYGKDGLVGLYRGFFASLYFTIASRALFFGIFDTIRLTLIEERKRQLSFLTIWCLAQASLIVSSIACYPLDTVRRRLMMQSGQPIKLYTNSLDCFNKILKTEGPASFYRGALSNSLKCTSGALILAFYYEALKYM